MNIKVTNLGDTFLETIDSWLSEKLLELELLLSDDLSSSSGLDLEFLYKSWYLESTRDELESDFKVSGFKGLWFEIL